MIATYTAELIRLVRPRVVAVTAAVVAVTSVAGTALVLYTAESGTAAAGAGPQAGGGPSIEALAAAGGGTDVFRTLLAFTGTFLFVVFVGAVAAEFSRGTIRTMLVRQPGRARLVAGKLGGMLTFAGATLLVAEVVTWVAARALAGGAGVDASAWASLDGLGAAVTDYGAVLVWMSAYAILGASIGVLIRSVPVALGVAIAWAGPIEHILQDAWDPASRVFPGLSLEAFAAGGTADVTAERALLTASLYVVVAAAGAMLLFARRDVTA